MLGEYVKDVIMPIIKESIQIHIMDNRGEVHICRIIITVIK